MFNISSGWRSLSDIGVPEQSNTYTTNLESGMLVSKHVYGNFVFSNLFTIFVTTQKNKLPKEVRNAINNFNC